MARDPGFVPCAQTVATPASALSAERKACLGRGSHSLRARVQWHGWFSTKTYRRLRWFFLTLEHFVEAVFCRYY